VADDPRVQKGLMRPEVEGKTNHCDFFEMSENDQVG
jgi:hypothetical protein